MEAFHFLVRRPPARPVNCPVGTVLEFLQARLSAGLIHSTLKVYVAAIAAYHAPLGGQSMVRHPLVTCFLRGALRLRPLAREAYAKWWIRMLFHSLESSDLPSHWGSRLTPPEVGVRDAGPAYFSHTRLLCSLALVVLFHTRQGFESLAAWASRSHSIFDAARVPEGEHLQVTYVIMVP